MTIEDCNQVNLHCSSVRAHRSIFIPGSDRSIFIPARGRGLELLAEFLARPSKLLVLARKGRFARAAVEDVARVIRSCQSYAGARGDA
ncbi:hypothetical protein LIER_33747 [Lithospermum erythrorhizon]|uniref:Uncharacterized protein n=1 Tax=Lithospermum erythrorhizon TaxID=34254 RepID=A0AAV3RYG0_LITER